MSDAPVVEEEIELKFVLGERDDVPRFEGLGSLGLTSEFELNALYFDTPDLLLTRTGVSLRRRSGGDDAGWHLKASAEGDRRKVEIRAEITGARPPAVLRDVLGEVVHPSLLKAALVPVARLRTIRAQTPLVDAQGSVLAKICVDQVWSEVPPPSRHEGRWEEPTWRELEVELADGTEDLLEVMAAQLAEAGITGAQYSSKVSHALLRAEVGRDEGGGAEALSVWEYAATQVGVIQTEEDGVLVGEEEAIHKTRVAARRLRSTLETFAHVFEPDLARPLGNQLRWLGLVLGEVRDAQVLRGHINDTVEIAGLVGTAEAASLERNLTRRVHRAAAHARDVLDTPHFEILHDTLAEFASPHSRKYSLGIEDGWALPSLSRPLGAVGNKYLVSLGAPRQSEPSEQQVEAWHSLRKRAKRVRYGFEALIGVYGEAALGRASAWKEVTTTFGMVQDSAVALQFLQEAPECGDTASDAMRNLVIEEKKRQEAVGAVGMAATDAALTLSVLGEP